MSKYTLLQETIDKLTEHGKTPVDVCWVGSKDGKLSITWEKFTKITDLVYDSGFGGQEVATDLVVVGVSWWLDRREYDGSEWWDFHSLPVMRPDAKPYSLVAKGGCSWETLEQHNE